MSFLWKLLGSARFFVWIFLGLSPFLGARKPLEPLEEPSSKEPPSKEAELEGTGLEGAELEGAGLELL